MSAVRRETVQAPASRLKEMLYIYPLTGRGKPAQFVDPLLEFEHRTTAVAPLEMVQPHTYKQDALVEIAYIVGLSAPEQLQRLMLLKIEPGVKLLYGSSQRVRGWLSATRGEVGAGALAYRREQRPPRCLCVMFTARGARLLRHHCDLPAAGGFDAPVHCLTVQ